MNSFTCTCIILLVFTAYRRALERMASEPLQHLGELPWLTPEQDIRAQHSKSTPSFHHQALTPPPTSKSLIQFSPDPKHAAKLQLEASSKEHNHITSEDTEETLGQQMPVNQSPQDLTIEVIYSPTKFYTAGDTESMSSHSDSEDIEKDPSSMMFLPRGFSAGPQLASPGYSQSPIQHLLNQLSGAESEQEDQAPDLEIDPYEINID